MHAGSCFWRPGMVEHGPMYSRHGGLFFSCTKGGSLRTTWVPVPGWEQQIERCRLRDPVLCRSSADAAAA